MATPAEEWLIYLDPVLVVSLGYVVVIINLSRDPKAPNVFYTLYTSNAISLFLYHIAMYCKVYAMRNHFVDHYPTMARIYLYLQIGGFFSISIGTILVTVNQYCALGDPIRYSRISRRRNVVALLVAQYVISYGHCLPVLFKDVSFLPVDGGFKYIAFTQEIDILVNLSSCIISIIVAIICIPTLVLSWNLLRVKKHYPVAEHWMVYNMMVLFIVHFICGADKLLFYFGKAEPLRFLVSIALITLHYFMDLHLAFTIAMPIVSYSSLRMRVITTPFLFLQRLFSYPVPIHPIKNVQPARIV